jgi:ATP-dependent DNA helicase PIF1
MKLETNMRLDGSTEDVQLFAQELLDIGEGRVGAQSGTGKYRIQIDPAFQLQNNSLGGLCEFVYSGLTQLHSQEEWLCSRSILCPTNDAVQEVNNVMLNCFPGEEKVYRSADRIVPEEGVDFNENDYPIEFLNSICTTGMPPHILKLKVGCPIMLLRNLDPANGHCNGTRYVVTKLGESVIEAKVAMGTHAGETIFIPRITLSPSDTSLPFKLQRKQFPVRICFAMTANKAQGQTLSKIGIYLHKDFFTHGQLYVAMSRVKCKGNLKIFTKSLPVDEMLYTDNIVYREILS